MQELTDCKFEVAEIDGLLLIRITCLDPKGVYLYVHRLKS